MLPNVFDFLSVVVSFYIPIAMSATANLVSPCYSSGLLTMHFIKKCTYVSARQSQGIRLRLQSESKGLNESLPALIFQRSTIQTKSMQRK